MIAIEMSEYVVPILRVENSLPLALEYDLSDLEGKSEGVVIQPLNEPLTWGDSVFRIKKKCASFNDGSTKNRKPKEPIPSEVQQLRVEFMGLLNENRLLDLFSKEGQITDQKQIGKYIGLLLEDAKADFHDITGLPKKHQKHIINHGSMIVPMLQKYL